MFPDLIFISPYWTSVAINALVLAITVTGLYISNSAGTMSVGHAALAGAAAYFAAVLTTNFGWPFLPAVLVGAMVGAALGLLLALLTVRMSLLVAGLCTLAFGQMLVVISYNIDYIGGGSSFYGIPSFTTLGVALIGLVVALYIAWGFDRSRLGNSALAIRDDALAASSMGVNVAYVKLAVFALGAAITGAGGVLRVHYVLVQRPDDLGFFISLPLVIMWVVGGSYIFFGPAVGAILLTFLPELLRFSTTGRLVLYGILLAFFVITRPQGLVPRMNGQSMARAIDRLRRKSSGSHLSAAGNSSDG